MRATLAQPMALLENIPPSLMESLSNPPTRGNRNVWLFTVAVQARHVATKDKLRTFLKLVTATWTDRDFAPEIERALTRAYNPPNSPSSPNSPSPSTKRRKPASAPRPLWPTFDPDAWQRRIEAHTHHLFDLKPLNSITSSDVIDALFPADALLCLAQDARSAITKPREFWRGKEAALQFMVANAMSKETGYTQSGSLSTRCIDNAAKHRRYQVVEFDRGTFEEQAAILTSLDTTYTPLVLVVHSGGKSLHGWFDLNNMPEHAQLRFFRHAVHLGADKTLWDISKLVRLPGGRRDNTNSQSILYFDPR